MLIRDRAIRLFNADGSEPEMSGNGTRCAAALLIDSGRRGGSSDHPHRRRAKHLRLLAAQRPPVPVRNEHGLARV